MKFNNNWINNAWNDLSFKDFTNIQKKVIPLILENKNVIGVSNTGTGKTFSFILPILDSINYDIQKISCIIISPTRELAKQIFNKIDYFKKFNPKLSSSLLIGGKEYDDKKILGMLNKNILISTPQKFLDICKLINSESFNNLKTIVLDEADMLIDINFFNSLIEIFSNFKNIDKIQKLAFSATLHEKISIQLSKFFKNTTIIDVSQNIWVNPLIQHHVISFQNIPKDKVLIPLLNKLNPYFCIIFCNTKKNVNLVFKIVNSSFPGDVIALHGDLKSRERKNIFKMIYSKTYKFLIATDLASRGIDIEHVSDIISFDTPEDDIWYIHRSGRAGRSNHIGNSYIFFEKNANHIIRLQKKGIKFNSIKFDGKNFLNTNIKYKEKIKKETEVDKKIQKAISTSSKKIKPNYKKKLKLEIKEIKRKEKRNRIEELVNKERIKNYKIKSSQNKKEKSDI